MINLNVIINLDAIKRNVLRIKKNTDKDVIAVVKSNAYGLGSREIIKALLGEVNYFFFNKLTEYLKVEDLLKNKNVIIFESLSKNNILKYYKKNMILTINNIADLRTINDSLLNVRVHLQVDTGMNRCGIRNIEECNKIINIIKNNHNIILEGIYTHYASSLDEYKYFNYQQEEFKKYLSLYDFKCIHASATSSLHKNIIGNMVRVGMGLYGYHTKLKLEKVVFAYTKVINTFNVSKNTFIGYNKMYKSKMDEKIAVLDFGYFDTKFIKNVFFKCRKYELIGKQCMNHSHIIIGDEICVQTHMSIFENFDIINTDEYDYYQILTSLNHLQKSYVKGVFYDLSNIHKYSIKKSFGRKLRKGSN